MKTKKTACLLVLLMMTVMLAGLLSACKGGTPVERIDPKRTQLYIGNYNGGYGDAWLNEYKQRFEALHKDEVYETDKKGVQVIIENEKEKFTAHALLPTISHDNNDIYFISGDRYYEYVARDLILDITDVVTGSMSKYSESGTIEAKMPDAIKNYLNVDGKYYALGSGGGSLGIVYDVDLFDQRKLFLDNSGGFTNLAGNLSAGPDGTPNTYDDGLPATYEEFFRMCERMKNLNIIPLSWTGQHSGSYSTFVLKSLWADYEGPERSMLAYNRGQGAGSNVAEIITGFDANTKPIIDTVEITKDNYNLLAKQPGRYYGLKFWETIIKEGYYSSLSTNVSQSHVMAQADFLGKKYEGEPIAMLIEGTWWENEATDAEIFSDMVKLYGEGASLENRRFGFLPMPNATSEKLNLKTQGERKNTLYSGISLSFINKKVPDFKKELAKDFLRYCFTDEALNIYTASTGQRKDFKYELTQSTLSKLSYFSKSYIEVSDNSDKAYTLTDSPATYNEIISRVTNMEDAVSKVTYKGKTETYNVFLNALRVGKIPAEEYFQGLYAYIS